jgi:hypothetical protein
MSSNGEFTRAFGFKKGATMVLEKAWKIWQEAVKRIVGQK